MAEKAPIAVISTPRSRWSDGLTFGLDDPVEDARILDKPLRHWRPADRLLSDPSGQLTGPLLLCGQDLWVSARMLQGFEHNARALGAAAPIRLARDIEGPGRWSDPLGRLPRSADATKILFDLWYLPEGVSIGDPAESWPSELDGELGVDVEKPVFNIDVDVDPSVSEGGTMALGFCEVAAAPVGHWVELVRTNLLAIGTAALGRGPIMGPLGLAWGVIRAMSFHPNKVAAKLTRRGKGCRIHPSAVIEGCTLGDNVHVDACAILRGCTIGDNVKIGPLAVAEFAVIGDGAELQRRATANLCVVYPGARIGGLLQLGVAGRDCRHKYGAVTTDMNPTGPVRVMTPEGLSAVDIGYQGVCLGHESFIGAGLYIAAGRLIGSGRTVLSESRMIVRS